MRPGLVFLAGAVYAADQICKKYVEEKLSPGQAGYAGPHVVITRTRNRGAAMNIGENTPEFIALTSGLVLAGTGCAFLSRALSDRAGLCGIGLSLLTGGGASNVRDRIRQGYVTDYIRLRTGNRRADDLVFNLGDFAIFAGGLLFLAGRIREEIPV